MLKVHFVFLFLCLLSSAVAKRKVRQINNEYCESSGSRIGNSGNDEANKEAQDKAMKFGQKIAQEAMEIAADAQAQQGPLGAKASHEAMQALAEKAAAFAKQADAVLAGKVAVVEEIVQEISEAGDVVTEETNSLRKLKDVLNDSKKMSETSRREVKILAKSLQYTKDILTSLESTQKLLSGHMQKTQQVIDAAKHKVEELTQVVEKEKSDLQKAKSNAKSMKEAQDSGIDNDAEYPENVDDTKQIGEIGALGEDNRFDRAGVVDGNSMSMGLGGDLGNKVSGGSVANKLPEFMSDLEF